MMTRMTDDKNELHRRLHLIHMNPIPHYLTISIPACESVNQLYFQLAISISMSLTTNPLARCL